LPYSQVPRAGIFVLIAILVGDLLKWQPNHASSRDNIPVTIRGAKGKLPSNGWKWDIDIFYYSICTLSLHAFTSYIRS
jgi:hypothetical protein